MTGKNELGALLRQWRLQREQSLTALAGQADVSKATLSSWETGRYQPRLPELDRLLDALGTSSEQRTIAFSMIDAPRAVRRMRVIGAEVGAQVEGSTGEPFSIPCAGDLLRALRHRRGLSLTEVAVALGVQPSTVSRWEQSETSPADDRLSSLLRILDATEAEREAIASGSRFLASFATANGETLDVLVEEHDALAHRTSRGDRSLMDLEFLSLQARIGRLTARCPGARELLVVTWASYANLLGWDGRGRESLAYSQRVIDWARRHPAFLRAHPHCVLTAIQLKAFSLRSRPEPSGQIEGVECLAEWLDAWNAPQWQTVLYRDMADLASGAGHAPAALAFIEEALASAERANDGQMHRLARHVQIDVILRSGRTADAIALLSPVDPEAIPIRRIIDTLQWADAMARVGEISELKNRLDQAYHLIDSFRYPNFRESADALARKVG